VCRDRSGYGSGGPLQFLVARIAWRRGTPRPEAASIAVGRLFVDDVAGWRNSGSTDRWPGSTGSRSSVLLPLAGRAPL